MQKPSDSNNILEIRSLVKFLSEIKNRIMKKRQSFFSKFNKHLETLTLPRIIFADDSGGSQNITSVKKDSNTQGKISM